MAPQGDPEPVRVHDFKDKRLGKAIPYRIYDLADDTDWVNVGIDPRHRTICRRVDHGLVATPRPPALPDATQLTITADCGGSNGNHTRLWKTELQRLADNTGLQITVCHLPPSYNRMLWTALRKKAAYLPG